jgi:predicted enzyme related to lactoylglutathione lyase
VTTRETAPAGAPCWADLWTSDVERASRFYGQLFDWEAQAPSAEFEGYFMFTRNGIPVAGGMGDIGDMRANNSWKAYLATDDIAKVLEVAAGNGARVVAPSMPVADLGTQAILVDPGGATIGVWQPGTFQGFSVLNEHGTPSWFELHTRDHAGAVRFYRTVFGWDATPVSDTDDFRYTVVKPSAGGDDVGGIMDGTRFRPDGQPDRWDIYWEVDDCESSVAKVVELGGSVSHGPDRRPYGTLAVVSDPLGAELKLRTSPQR